MLLGLFSCARLGGSHPTSRYSILFCKLEIKMVQLLHFSPDYPVADLAGVTALYRYLKNAMLDLIKFWGAAWRLFIVSCCREVSK
jgi:hypothetical protein